jgi:hypothetical protein
MSNKPYLPYMEFGPVSTSNRNTPSDYCLEQKQNKDNQEEQSLPVASGATNYLIIQLIQKVGCLILIKN